MIGTLRSRPGHGHTVPWAARFWPPRLVLTAPSLFLAEAQPLQPAPGSRRFPDPARSPSSPGSHGMTLPFFTCQGLLLGGFLRGAGRPAGRSDPLCYAQPRALPGAQSLCAA